MARPSIRLTDEQVETIEKYAGLLTMEQLAGLLGIGASTLYAIKQRDPRVSGAYQRGRSQTISAVASKLVAEALEGNTTAMIFYLKTQGRWSERVDEEKLPIDPRLAKLAGLDPDALRAIVNGSEAEVRQLLGEPEDD